MIITPADRISGVKEYYFSTKNKELARRNAERKAAGLQPIINLGIGAPDRRPPEAAIRALAETAMKDGVHAYQNYTGIPELRQAFARWYSRYYGVTLDPETEIQPLVGSKEGILLVSMAFVNKGDKVLVPDPGYPTYTSASRLVEAEILTYGLSAENGWEPDFEALERQDLSGVKLMWVNYPNMPTGAPASEGLYQRLTNFALKHKILIVNDNPYSFVQNGHPLSILGAENARECCLELNSLSKAHNMSGWRIGMIAGKAEYVQPVLKVKSQMDSGMFRPLQIAAIEALGQGPEWFRELNAEYARRKEAVCGLFDILGAEYERDSQGLFVWGRIAEGNRTFAKAVAAGYGGCAAQAAGGDGVAAGGRGGNAAGKSRGEVVSDFLLAEAGVFITPGFIFGSNGRDYIRASLCAPVETLAKAKGLLEKVLE